MMPLVAREADAPAEVEVVADRGLLNPARLGTAVERREPLELLLHRARRLADALLDGRLVRDERGEQVIAAGRGGGSQRDSQGDREREAERDRERLAPGERLASGERGRA